MAQSYFKKEFPAIWQRETNFTLEVAEAMSAQKREFKSMEECMSLRRYNLFLCGGHYSNCYQWNQESIRPLGEVKEGSGSNKM